MKTEQYHLISHYSHNPLLISLSPTRTILFSLGSSLSSLILSQSLNPYFTAYPRLPSNDLLPCPSTSFYQSPSYHIFDQILTFSPILSGCVSTYLQFAINHPLPLFLFQHSLLLSPISLQHLSVPFLLLSYLLVDTLMSFW